MKAKRIQRTDFSFLPSGHGAYVVSYQSISGKWTARITDMELIDNIKNTDEPLVKYLNELKRAVKRGYHE